MAADGGTWTVKRVLDWCEEYLRAHGDENPRLSAQWLVSHVTGLGRVELYTHFDQPLSPGERAALREALKRRGRGEPLQYISGEAAFRHIVVKAAPGVLVPRPETEVLVEVVLEHFAGAAAAGAACGETRGGAHGENGACGGGGAGAADAAGEVAETDEGAGVDAAGEAAGADAPGEAGARMRALEVGCGTGCVACSLAKEAGMEVVACDIAPAALACARSNVGLLGLADLVEVVEADCAAGIDAKGGFDVLVSNPPYIPTAELAELPDEVASFEPRLALDGGSDGLAFFDRLLELAPRALRPGGFFACELHETTLDEAARRARAAGFADVEIACDLAGRPRILSGTFTRP